MSTVTHPISLEMGTNQRELKKFFTLHSKGRSAGLDLCLRTGVVSCKSTENPLVSDGSGLGTPPQPFPSEIRVAECIKGVIKPSQA